MNTHMNTQCECGYEYEHDYEQQEPEPQQIECESQYQIEYIDQSFETHSQSESMLSTRLMITINMKIPKMQIAKSEGAQ